MSHMEHLDRSVAANIQREMSTAGIDLDRLSAEIGYSKKTLRRRLSEGSFRVREVGVIAAALGCPTDALMPDDKGAVA